MQSCAKEWGKRRERAIFAGKKRVAFVRGKKPNVDERGGPEFLEVNHGGKRKQRLKGEKGKGRQPSRVVVEKDERPITRA